ncbi:hypothetical protein LIER_16637 [Lithospermum erythrorhizon]|uniref:RING-type domain-containing protein n=1 Tax=Lithospermum erythrorhizon TaxID=34254 RepID=A0AAV3Q7G1_LITER
MAPVYWRNESNAPMPLKSLNPKRGSRFVEAVIGMQAGPQYPEEPPHISIIDSKGLDEQRQTYLITTIREKATELTSYQMLVALCEEIVEQLSIMNHPDGDCPLCLTPLVDEDGSNKSLSFMKLMSCFHCFHGECIIRWWNWLQLQNETDSSHATSSSSQAQKEQGIHEKSMGRCPVCRKVFLPKDIEHVLDLVGTTTSLDDSGSKIDDDENILHSDSEIIRRKKFEAILKIQQERSGLIEPKKNEVLLPGMYLPRPVASPVEVLDTETAEEQRKHLAANSRSDMHAKPSTQNSSNSRSQRASNTSARRNKTPPLEQNRKEKEANTRGTSSKPSTSKDRNATARKDKGVNPKPQVRQWVRKENDPTS